MSIQENVARSMRRVRQERHISIELFADELGITKTSAQLYLKGEGNPRADTLEHIARKLEIDPAALVLGLFELDKREITLLLLDTIQSVAELPESRRLRFAELFLEMVKLWNVE